MNPQSPCNRKIKRALISVTDKNGLDRLCSVLHKKKIEIISSGGTAKYLNEKNIPIQEVSDFTGVPEMLDGRLKTLHPKIYGGILAIRDNEHHMKDLKTHEYVPIDLVVVNLYAFEQKAQKLSFFSLETIEQVDIGGPTLLRAAAKNFPFVTVLTSPDQYEDFLNEFEKQDGCTTLEFRKQCAQKVFERTAKYDACISGYFQQQEIQRSNHIHLDLDKKWSLRYGENPHQEGAFYLPTALQGQTVIDRVLQGKQLSYNNVMDIHAALDFITDFQDQYVVGIFKHTNPCGVGMSQKSLKQAYELALEGDPVSAFGGIVVFSHPLDIETAEICSKLFTEIVIAPSFHNKTQSLYSKKHNIRLVEVDLDLVKKKLTGFDIRRVVDGYLIQSRDRIIEDLKDAKVVSQRPPTSKEIEALTLAWKVVKHVKSNAIVLANENQTLGIGAGQMSRVDSSWIASTKANPEKLKGAAMASDAFFPFRDGLDKAATQKISCVVQPGGSVRDQEVIDAANEHNMAMLFTNVRHFRH